MSSQTLSMANWDNLSCQKITFKTLTLFTGKERKFHSYLICNWRRSLKDVNCTPFVVKKVGISKGKKGIHGTSSVKSNQDLNLRLSIHSKLQLKEFGTFFLLTYMFCTNCEPEFYIQFCKSNQNMNLLSDIDLNGKTMYLSWILLNVQLELKFLNYFSKMNFKVWTYIQTKTSKFEGPS